MKTLILMRHAKAETIELGMRDFDRKLAEKGKVDADAIAKLLKKKIPAIDLLITSLAKRTYKTAKIVAENYAYDKADIVPLSELYEAAVDEYLKVIRNIDDSKNTVIIVGHNPTIGAMSSILSGSKILNFKPGAVAAFNLSIDTWKLFKLAEMPTVTSLHP
ncbi:MAG: histidine phosphatase family protein [Bacteroidota bacterium]